MSSEPTSDEVRRVVSTLRVKQEDCSGGEMLVWCPSCGKPKMHVRKETGVFHCKLAKCGFSGGLWKLADFLGIRVRDGKDHKKDPRSMLRMPDKREPQRQVHRKIPMHIVEEKAAALWAESGEHQAGVDAALQWLRDRSFLDSTIRRFKLGYSMRAEKSSDAAVCIPYLVEGGAVMWKTRSWWKEKDGMHLGRVPAGVETPLYNSFQVEGKEDVLVVEGEWDVMAMYQMDWLDCCSGSSGARTWLGDWDAHLEHAKRIFVWLDNDEDGAAGREKIAARYGHRVHLVNMPADISVFRPKNPDALGGEAPKDANDLLKLGCNAGLVRGHILASSPIENSNVIHVRQWIESAFKSVEADAGDGLIRTSFAPFDHMLGGGMKEGEISVLTGAPGCGKSVFSDFVGRMVAKEGSGVLASNLENSSAEMMERARAAWRVGPKLENIDKLSPVPFWVTPPNIKPKALFDAARYAASALRTKLWIVDHLGWLSRQVADESGGAKSFGDLAWAVDKLMKEMAEFAEETKMHIFFLAHSNERDAEKFARLSRPSELAGAQAIQRDASNILVMGRPPNAHTSGKYALEVERGNKIKLEYGEVVLYGPKLRGGAQPPVKFRYEHTYMDFYESDGTPSEGPPMIEDEESAFDW